MPALFDSKLLNSAWLRKLKCLRFCAICCSCCLLTYSVDNTQLIVHRHIYVPPTPALEAKGLTAHTLGQIIGNINEQAERDVNENYNPLYSTLVFLPIIGVFIGFSLCIASMGSSVNSDPHSFSHGPPRGFHLFGVGMVIFGLSMFGQVITCCLVGRKHTIAIQIAIDAMKEYVEITLNEQWQKECGIRWTVATEQTLSVSSHRDSDSVHETQRINVKTWYNIEVRPLNQEFNPPQYMYAPSAGADRDNGMGGVAQEIVYQ